MKNIIQALLFILMILFPIMTYSQTGINKIADFSKSPFKIFKKSCSTCHGFEGSSYGKNFAVMSNDSLKEVISMMMYGPGQLTPSQEDIEAMVAYNKAISRKKPFAIVMNSKSFLDGKENNLKVKISSKAKLNVDNEQIRTEKSDSDYKLFYDLKKIKELKITVIRDSSSSSFIFPKQLWSK